MIVPVKGTFERDEYIVCPRAPITAEELHTRMLTRAKVIDGSYAYRLLDNLHNSIFVRSLDLKADYETFFSQEYESFGEFGRRRLRFSPEEVSSLCQVFEVSTGMYHFKPTYWFLAEEYGLDFLSLLLEDSLDGEAT